MNDEDKEAFEIFYNKHYGFQDFRDAAIEAWQAACEYKQKEIDAIDCYIERDEKVKKLQVENIKLRECVEHYGDMDDKAYVIQVLEELGVK